VTVPFPLLQVIDFFSHQRGSPPRRKKIRVSLLCGEPQSAPKCCLRPCPFFLYCPKFFCPRTEACFPLTFGSWGRGTPHSAPEANSYPPLGKVEQSVLLLPFSLTSGPEYRWPPVSRTISSLRLFCPTFDGPPKARCPSILCQECPPARFRQDTSCLASPMDPTLSLALS